MRIKQILNCVLSIISILVLLDCSPKKSIVGASNDHIPEKFAKYEEPANKSTEYIKTGWYMLNRGDSGVKRILDKTNEIFFVDPDPIVTHENIIEMKVEEHPQGYMMLSMKLDSQGSNLVKQATQQSDMEHIGFVLNDNLIFNAYIAAEVEGPWIGIFGERYDEEEYSTFKKLIEMNKK